MAAMLTEEEKAIQYVPRVRFRRCTQGLCAER